MERQRTPCTRGYDGVRARWDRWWHHILGREKPYTSASSTPTEYPDERERWRGSPSPRTCPRHPFPTIFRALAFREPVQNFGDALRDRDVALRRPSSRAQKVRRARRSSSFIVRTTSQRSELSPGRIHEESQVGPVVHGNTSSTRGARLPAHVARGSPAHPRTHQLGSAMAQFVAQLGIEVTMFLYVEPSELSSLPGVSPVTFL